MSHHKHIPLLSLLLLPAACTHRGTVVILDPASPPVYRESEPNDDVWNANDFGTLRRGDHFLIEGDITECCPDPFDGFAFYAAEPLEIFFELEGHGLFSDLDFCLYDPVDDQYIACFESEGDPEFGSLAIAGPGEFHLVVDSWYGDTSYTLQVEAFSLSGHRLAAGAKQAGAGAEPADEQRWGAYREGASEAARAELSLHDEDGRVLLSREVQLELPYRKAGDFPEAREETD